MPYRKRRYGSRRRIRKRRPTSNVTVRNGSYPVASTKGPITGLYQSASKWINSAYRGYSTAQKAYKLGSMAMSMLNSEKKYYDITSTTVTPSVPTSTYTTVSLLSAISQGDGPSNRDGSQIRVKSFQVQMTLNKNASATNTVCRWVLFIDRRVQIASTPGYTDLYDSTDVSNTFLNIEDQFKRFRIIRSGEVILDSDDQYKTVGVYVPCSLPVRYDTGNNVIMNNVWLMLVSSENVNTPTIIYRYRVRFYDN